MTHMLSYRVTLIVEVLFVSVPCGWFAPVQAQAQADNRSEIFLGYSYLDAKPDGASTVSACTARTLKSFFLYPKNSLPSWIYQDTSAP